MDKIKLFFAASILLLSGQVNALLIDFNDGAEKIAIGNFYSQSGVEFIDARWGEPTFHQAGTPSTGFNLESLSQDNNPQPDTPIIGLFTQIVTSISILAYDIGINGAQILAYDAIVGGNLVDSDSVVGTVFDRGVFATLTVSSPIIKRFELTQLTNFPGDGILFDNLDYIIEEATPVPAPPALLLFLTGLIGLGIARRKVRKS